MLLRRLYKYEFKALLRYLLPVWIALVGLALLDKISSELITNNLENLENVPTGLYTALVALAGSLSLLFFVGIYAAIIACFLLIAIRFYKNLYSSEGYFTMTMPFTATQHLVCKLICGALMLAASVAVAGLGLFIVSLGRTTGAEADIAQIISDIINSGTAGHVVLFIIELFLLGLSVLLGNLLCAYASVSLGQKFKNKTASAFGIYVGISFLFGAVESVVASVLMVAFFSANGVYQNASLNFFHLEIWAFIIMYAAMAAAGFVISYRSLKYKYNLE